MVSSSLCPESQVNDKLKRIGHWFNETYVAAVLRSHTLDMSVHGVVRRSILPGIASELYVHRGGDGGGDRDVVVQLPQRYSACTSNRSRD